MLAAATAEYAFVTVLQGHGVRASERACAARPVCARACVCTAWRGRPGACSWEHMLSPLAGGSVLGSSPGRGGGSRKPEAARAALHLPGRGYLRKPPCQGGGGTAPTLASYPHLRAQCAGWKGATGGGLVSAEEPLGPAGAAPWLTGSGADHTEVASRLHSEPTQRGRNESHMGLAQPVP